MKKIGLIALIVVLSLGIIGVGYAAWSQTLSVTGTVAAGTYDVQLTNVSKTDDVNGVATISATLADSHTITIALSKLYPGSVEKVNFDVKNNGTIPSKVTAITINTVSGTTLDIDLSGADAHNDVTASLTGITTSTTIAGGATITPCVLTFTTDSTADQLTSPESGTVTLVISTQQQY